METMSMNYYEDGNAARQLEQPVRREREWEDERERRRQIQRRKNRRNAARRNRERALAMGKGQVAILSCCVVACAAMAATYITVQAQLTTYAGSITAMESVVSDLKADNDEMYKTLTTSIDLDYIKDVAMNEFGMHYADEDQVVWYSVDKSSFMDQYADIPD